MPFDTLAAPATNLQASRTLITCSALPYAADPASESSGRVRGVPLSDCCVVSDVQFGQIVSCTPTQISIEFRAQGTRQTSAIKASDLPSYLRRNQFELVAFLASGLHRIVGVEAP